MTSISEEQDEQWPTDWHMIDDVTKVECRQLSMDTFELKSASHIVTLNREGFDLYRNGPDEAFDKWLDENHIVSRMIDGTQDD